MKIYITDSILQDGDNKYIDVCAVLEQKYSQIGTQPDSVIVPYEIKKVSSTSNGSIETIIMLLGAHTTQYINVIKNVYSSYEYALKNEQITWSKQSIHNIIYVPTYVPTYFNIPPHMVHQCPLYIGAGAYINDARSPISAKTYSQCMLNIECVLQVANSIDSDMITGADADANKQFRIPHNNVYTCVTPSRCTTAGTAYASGNAHLNHLAILALRLKSTGNKVSVIVMDHVRPDGAINILNNRDIPIASIYRESGPLPVAQSIKESGPVPECIQLQYKSGDVEFTRAVMRACDYLKKYCLSSGQSGLYNKDMSASFSNLNQNEQSNQGQQGSQNNQGNQSTNNILIVYMPHDLKNKFNINNMQMCGKQFRAATNCKILIVVTDLEPIYNAAVVDKNYITEFSIMYNDTVNNFILGTIVF